MTFPSIYFFISYGAVSFLLPYFALFYQSQGMSGGQMGLLTAIPPIISFFGAPLWTGAADATRRHKLATVVSTLGVVIVTFIFPSVASFGGLLLMICLFSLTNSPISSLVNSAVLVQLGDRKPQYGRIRLWGTIGYGILAPFAGSLIGKLGLQWSFWGFAILMLLSLFVVLVIPFHQSHVSSMQSFGQGVRVLLRNKAWMLFLVMVFIAGLGLSTVNNYLFVFMNYLGASKSLMGIALTVSTISEIPAMFFSDRLLRRFGAQRHAGHCHDRHRFAFDLLFVNCTTRDDTGDPTAPRPDLCRHLHRRGLLRGSDCPTRAESRDPGYVLGSIFGIRLSRRRAAWRHTA